MTDLHLKPTLVRFTFLILILFTGNVIGQSLSSSADLRINTLVYGTLISPETPSSKIAIIIPGSGPTDRNGNQQMMRNNSLKLLAEGLAQEGVASFRYDKRILTLLKQNALNEETLRFDMFIEDAVAVVNHFKEEGRYKEIYIIGHSQGSLVGMVAAQETKIDGFISLAGPGQAIDKTIVNQIGLQMPDLKDAAQQALETLKRDGRVNDFSPALISILRPSVQPFMASWMQYDPREEIGKLAVPTLIVNGTKDVQVSEEEAQQLKLGKNDATLVFIEKMNHVLRIIEGDNLENTKSYNQHQLPISEELIKIIAQFIKR